VRLPRPIRNSRVSYACSVRGSSRAPPMMTPAGYPLMVAIQQISARIGRTTGKGIAGNLRQHYPNWLLQAIVALLFVANTINIGADLGAMADALRLLIGGPSLIYVIAFGSLCAILQVFMAYPRYVAALKWLTLAYFGTVMVVDIPWAEAARGFLIP